MRKTCHRQTLDPMAWIAKRTPLADDQQRDLGIAYHASLQALLRGHGTEQTWATLACSLNIALILCEQGICAGGIETIKLAQSEAPQEPAAPAVKKAKPSTTKAKGATT